MQNSPTPCPHCGSIVVSIAPGAGPHWKSLRCADCDRFLRWLPKPDSLKNLVKK